ncbi:MAG: DUF6263 family protein [Rectinemataceae bacterium]
MRKTILPLVIAIIACLRFAVWADDGAEERSIPPRFDSTSQDRVLLRYKYIPGHRTVIEVEIDMSISIEAAGPKMAIEMPMKLGCYYTVKSVDGNGDATAEMVITKMALSVTSPQGDMTYDSDRDDGSDPKFGSLKAMMNVPIPVKVSTLGKVLEMDVQPMEEAIKRSGAAALNLGDTTDKIVKSTFVMLPEGPVRASDTYDAGEIVQQLQNMGEMTSKVKYEVLSISSDGTKALLKPRGEFSLDPTAGGEVNLKLDSFKLDGWILFNIADGDIERSYGDIEASILVTQNEQSMNFSVNTRVFNDQVSE